MNLDSLSYALSEINFAVANLTRKNFKSTNQELNHLVSVHGVEAERHLLSCLFSHIDLGADSSNKSVGQTKESCQVQYLIKEFDLLIIRPNFVSTLCFVFDSLISKKILKVYPGILSQLSQILKLSRVQEIAFGIALQDSSDTELKNLSVQFVRQKFPDLIKAYTKTDSHSGNQEGDLQDSAPEVLHLILLKLLTESEEEVGVSERLKQSFVLGLRQDFPRELVPTVLAPLLYSDMTDISLDKINSDSSTFSKNMMERSLCDSLLELGYGVCGNVEDCRNTLQDLGLQEITPASVAKILGMMARTHTGLNEQLTLQSLQSQTNIWNEKEKSESNVITTWNVDCFIHALEEVTPTLNWADVVSELDHAGFHLKDRQGLKLLMTALNLGLRGLSFPVASFYKLWDNTEGQLSLVQQILKNPDVFCWADHQCHFVNTEILKSQPENDSKEISNWKSLDLVEMLLRLGDAGHHNKVLELFKFPLQHCPDILILSVLQVNQHMKDVKKELLSSLIPIFLGNHPNSAVILHYTWHSQQNITRHIMMLVMAEWYVSGEGDQQRLSRILDIAQDLKALSMLLNINTSFQFTMDLACLASRREYLKLEKWLSDQLLDHGERFASECVKFLHRRCPQIMGGVSKDDLMLGKGPQLPSETLATILAGLQASAGNFSQELSDTIATMVNNCNLLLSRSRQPPPGVKTTKGIDPGFNSNVIGNNVNSSNVDFIPNLTSGIANMSMGSGSASLFNLPGILNQFNNPPASPQRLIGPSGANTPSNSSQSLLSNLGVPHLTQHMASNGSQIGLGTPSKAPLSPLTRMNSSFPTNNSVTGVERVRQGDIASLFPDLSGSREIEDEANGYFQRIYTQPPHLTIDEVLEILKKFKESSIKRERDVFHCMIKNLFEEYKFFPQYPDKELQITAQLFGGIIEQNLLTYMVLGVALRYVLDALRKPHGSKMYSFGIAALDKFRGRLKEYPQYCQHLANIPHFQEFPSHLIEYIEYGARSMDPPRPPGSLLSSTTLPGLVSSVTSAGKTVTSTTTTTTSTMAKTGTAVGSSRQPNSTFRGESVFKVAKEVSAPKENSSPSIANTTNINTLLVATEKEEKVLVPPEVLQDKIGFIFNNLSQMNLSTKCDELRELVTEDYWPWVAQYLVMKRVSIEPNFHLLYSNFLDTLKMADFGELVLKETYRNIKVLLRSDKKIANFSDRSLLKNLGHWLGMLTLARSRPILQIDIDIKALLIEAYHKGLQELLYVVPFVAKVLESCAKNKVFKPPNPWTLGILNVLAELHQETNLKLNLKFEIEVLCKNLTISISSMTPGAVLKDLDRYAKIEHQLSNPKKADPSPSLPGEETNTNAVETTQTPSSQANFTTTTSTPTPPSGIAEPRFAYTDINVSSLSGLEAHITINPQRMLGCQSLIMVTPHFKQLVKTAVERAVHDWVTPVVDRSVKVALFAAESIIKKDFALDPDENRMRSAAHHMVRTLTAGMAMITCRDHLSVSIGSNLKASILSALRAATPQQKEIVEQIANTISQDNVELACAFVQKTAVEKSIPEIDKRLTADYELRKLARNEGRRYCDQYSLTYHAERMPEQIRLKVGGVTPQQGVIYEEYARNIPGFLPVTERDTSFILKPTVSYGNDEMSQIYDKILAELEPFVSAMNNDSGSQAKALGELLEAVAGARHSRDSTVTETVVQKAVNGLLEGMGQMTDTESFRFRDCHLFVLKSLQDPRAYGPQWVNKLVTRFLTEASPEVKYNFDAIDCLIRSHLVNMQLFDAHLSNAMDNGMNYMAVSLAMHIVKTYLVDEKHSCFVSDSDIFSTVSVLARIAIHARPPPEGLPALIDIIRNSSSSAPDRLLGGPTSIIHSGITQARELDDPPGLHEKTEYLLHEWVQMYHQLSAGRDSTNAFSLFVHQLHNNGILKNDDYITRFFKLCTQLCVELCYRALNESNSTSPSLIRAKCFHNLDPFVRLTALLVKHSSDTHQLAKINILNKVLGLVAGVLLQDQEMRGTDFQPLPYHRIIIMLFMELNVPDQVLENLNMQVLTSFCKVLHILCPCKAPGFAYSWLEIVAHRMFIYRIMALPPQQTGWGMYATLLVDLFKFLAPFLRNADLAKPVMLLYKGTLRVLLVLLHDFPEFLCDYHYGFCDVIPPNCIQMRNLILSAFPRNMRLPDPFTPNLKVDMLPEISHQPRIMANFASMIQPLSFKRDLDSYLKTRSPVTFLSDLRSNLQVSNEPGLRYNIPLINALVLYVGTQAISYILSKGHTPSMTTVPHSSHMDIFQNLAVDLNTEGRYLFLNAIANQLRYPNCHTHYFSCTLLYLFAEANNEAIQEQITRVLIERLIVNRPHPWGLLITFIELIKNPSFKFWSHEFVRCAPEIEKLFDSVARSCMVQKQPPSNRDPDGQE